MATPIRQVPWESYYFVAEGNDEYSSHTMIWAGMVIEFIVEVHAKDRTDKCARVAYPPRKATLAGIKAWFDKHADCVVCDREVPVSTNSARLASFASDGGQKAAAAGQLGGSATRVCHIDQGYFRNTRPG